MPSEIHADDVGTQLIFTVKEDGQAVDISLATTTDLEITKPDTTKLQKNASFFTDGTDGKLVYVIESGDINIPGIYRIQAKIGLGGGSYSSSIATFKVHCNL